MQRIGTDACPGGAEAVGVRAGSGSGLVEEIGDHFAVDGVLEVRKTRKVRAGQVVRIGDVEIRVR